MKSKLPEFTQLVKLAKTDPEALEVLRVNAIDALIQAAPESSHRQLKGLNFKINMLRRQAKNPNVSYMKISHLIHQHLHALHQDLLSIKETKIKSHTPEKTENSTETDNKIIPFPQKRKL